MKKISIYTLLLAAVLMSFQACGPSEEERRAAEEARLDSLRQVEQERIAEQMEQARQDSIAEAEERRRQKEEAGPKFSEDGSYVVQVGAFRSEANAESYLESWSDREYPHAYVVKYGNEETGNVWFRLRVGFFDSEEEAAKLGEELAKEINTGYWVSEVERSS